MSLRSPMGRALGRGTGAGAVHHWWIQRLTAIALMPLGIWFLLSLVRLPLTDYATVTAWVAAGLNPVWLGMLVIAAAWHGCLGIQVIIEDYVHHHGAKSAALVLNTFAHVLLGAAGLYTVLRIALRSYG